MFRRRRSDDDFRREIEAHVAIETDRLIAEGVSPDQARHAARRAFGNATAAQERFYESRRILWIDDLRQDVRYAIRTLRRAPGFAAVAIFTIALGVGANTTIFSVVEALLLRSLPVRDPGSLVRIEAKNEGRESWFSYPMIQELSRVDVFDGLFGFSRPGNYNVRDGGAVESTPVALVTGGYYDTLGITPAIGRLIRPDDDRRDAVPVAVLSYGYWQRKFGSDPSVIGRALTFELTGTGIPEERGTPATIVGVSSPGFTGVVVGRPADITFPIGVLPQVVPTQAISVGTNGAGFQVMARSRPGLSTDTVEQRLAAEWRGLVDKVQPSPPTRNRLQSTTLSVVPGGNGWTALRERFGRPLQVLMTMVSLVLLIACANVANLLLARTGARHRELVTRLAVGAGRFRLARQLLAESLVLSAAGSMLALAIAWLGSRRLLSIIQRGAVDPIVLDVSPDLRVLAYTALLAVTAALLFGVVPAWRSASLSLVNRGASGDGHRPGRLAPSLVAIQVALCIFLLIGGGLFVRTLQNLRDLDIGFRHQNVLTFDLDSPRRDVRGAALNAYLEEVRGAVARVPGVTNVGFVGATPLSGAGIGLPVTVDGERVGAPMFGGKEIGVYANYVAPGYFASVGTDVRTGRDFRSNETLETAHVVIVNEEFARSYLRGDPMGQTISIPGSERRIVGVVRNAVYRTLKEPPPPMVYLPFSQANTGAFFGGATFTVAGPRGASTLIAIQRAVSAHTRGVPVEIRSLTDEVERTIVQERLMASLAGAFALLALLLAAVGVYGLLSYAVTRRTNELGVRIAVGAQAAHVRGLVMREAAQTVAIGLAIGLPLAWAFAGAVRSMLFQIEPTDPVTITAAVIVLVLAALVAAYLPARRAMRVDPLTALRSE